MNKQVTTPLTSDSDAHTHLTVHCQGESPVMGHPIIYLTFKEEQDHLKCPYCGKAFQRLSHV